jgi:hypothetical protein
MTHAELRQLFEAQAAAAEANGNALAKIRAAIFTHLAATACTVPHGRLSELGELVRLAPVSLSRARGEVGTTFRPRNATEFAAGMVNRLRPQGTTSNLYAPKAYREIMRR